MQPTFSLRARIRPSLQFSVLKRYSNTPKTNSSNDEATIVQGAILPPRTTIEDQPTINKPITRDEDPVSSSRLQSQLGDDDSYQTLQLVKRRAVPLGKAVSRDDYESARDVLSQVRVVASDRGEKALPMSPLLSPALIEARTKHHAPKPRPAKVPETDFRRVVSESTDAAMLASPVRMCGLTGARLPSDFLLGHTLRTHPQTGKPWQIPILGKSGRLAVTHYTSAYEAMAFTANLKFREFVKTISPRWKDQFSSLQVKEIVFRKDMADAVLGASRRRIMDALLEAADNGNVSDDLAREGLMLWAGGKSVPEEYHGRRITDLKRLLGESHELKHNLLCGATTVLLKKEETQSLVRWITKLEMYIKD